MNECSYSLPLVEPHSYCAKAPGKEATEGKTPQKDGICPHSGSLAGLKPDLFKRHLSGHFPSPYLWTLELSDMSGALAGEDQIKKSC